MKKDIERLCKNCEFWVGYEQEAKGVESTGSKVCHTDAFRVSAYFRGSRESSFIFPDVKVGDTVRILTGPNFGCIHFKARP